MRVVFGSDHAGFALKQHLVALAEADGFEVTDLGTNSSESVDYPDLGALVGRAVSNGEADRGVLICGSGNGIAIAANKINGVRCAVAHDATSARLAVEHNDANICSFGARFIGEQTAEDAMRAFLTASFAGGRHAARVAKITELESN
ncbi:ribose-5-phosphate isomerase [Actinobacteria bacterium IMCC26256]|nr:ribose-5-phosphate isomerase [Actinobacteria bacterium IMCC26256]